MSLNGLDTPAVQEAYQQAIAEAGGWFLLKYTSRDSVELLGRGRGGVHEARNAITKYDELSPLYGLIIYRRRKFLIKYVPEGTSRLLQARTAVHFCDILERYSPYETLLEITSADSLNDTSLAYSFPLHTASPSASSNRLHEISEDGEEAGIILRRPANHSFSSAGSIFGTQRYKMEKRVDQVMKSEVPKRKQTPSIEVTDSGSTLSSPISSPQKASVSQYLVRDESGQRSILSLESKRSLVSMTDYSEASDKTTETSTKPDVEPTARPSVQKQHPGNPSHEASQPSLSEATQQASSDGVASGLSDRSVERPSPEEATSISEQPKYDDEPYDFSKLDFIPKVKLGPRPVAHRKEAKRPAVAGVAAVPAAYRPAQKKQEPIRPRSQAPVNVPARAPTVLPRPPPIPVAPEYSPRPVSRGSVKSMPSHKSAAMTPDKARLMKAVELRRRQLRKSNPQSSHELPPLVVEATAVPTVLEPSDRELAQVAERLAATETELQPDDDHQAIPKKPDSGIELDYEKQQEKLEEGSATEEPKGPPADPTTLARLQPSPSSSRKSLPLDVRRPPSTARSADDADGGAEPTVSLDMLEDSSQPAFPWLLDEQSAESPASEEEIDVETPAEQATDSSTSSRTPSFRPRSPALRQPETYRPTGADRAERQRSNDDTLVPNGTHGSGPGSPRRNHDDLAKRRRGIVEPLHIDPQAEEMTPDEEFLEELHSATVQRATPVNVAKSPMSRDLDRRPSAQSVPSSRSNLSVQSVDIRRSSSVSVEQYDTEAQDGLPGRTRSLTTPYAEKEDSVHGLKRNVSTGISRRIQALAEQSSREVSRSNTPQPTASEAGGIATWRDRKTAVRSPPPPTRSRTGSYRRQSGRSTPVVQQPEPVRNVHHDPLTNRDSVSVSARIVRPGQGQGHDYFGDSSIDAQLHHSQLTVNRKQAPVIAHHQATTPPALNTTITTSSHSPPAAEYRQLHSAARSSLSSRQKQSTLTPATPSADDFPPPPADRNSTTSSTTNDSHATSKSGTRTSRFFKRMSNLGGGGGGGHSRNVSGHSMRLALRSLDMSFPTAPPPPRNGSIVATTSRSGSLAAATDKGDVPPPVVVGDLNIQFPDSLLWKRRIVEIDETGHLVFAVSQAMDVQRAAVKRFHLNEFRQPYAPDLDRQELPHSVMLEFADGTSLQAACEDAMTARQVLHVLKNYWKAWN